MVCYFVNTSDHRQLIYKALNNIALDLSNQGIDIKIGEETAGKTTVFKCKFPQGADGIWRKKLASSLAELVTKNVTLKYIQHLLANSYTFLKDIDKKIICKKAVRLNYQRQRNGFSPQKSDIYERLENHLQGANTIVFEGFIRFCLPGFEEGLRKIVERALDDYMLEKEYREFRKLLQYFVDIQEPQNDLLNIFCLARGKIIITNEKGIPLPENCWEEALQVLMSKNLDSEDILISTLLALAPKEILIHAKKGNEIIDLIEGVFGSRVKICPGCSMCKDGILNVLEKPDLPIQ